ncbi:hypothetical protein HA72_2054 [Metallosphaera sedula]|uniref:Uncharacterized protein n=3 Tax=Metallosphaera TaxID=41980 RepID=A4YIE2_METS5|nr:hypothetical protein Msed_2054 [Metallosphaera sedula DSM 5348]AIM28177.1 hypothetical protein HA72_2054 [Metallosphaera sedula]QCO30408.1 hypothetical protein DFR88_07890 [Metallosphaera prunae]AKV74994.1 hypothetical protein MsedA_2104 [Metallosphaera sedula]AKV77232.1 hypothetical protein MsedB_2106 [Metallosphaera sedula]
MFEVWYITIGLSIFAAILSVLTLVEFSRLRMSFGGKISVILTVLAVLFTAQGITYSFSFFMWSHDKDPLYVYPSLTMSIIDALSMSLLYYYLVRY